MNARPGGAELLAIARETLLGALIPSLSGENRYMAHMIVNAIAIAARDLARGDDAARAELDRVEALAGPGEAAEASMHDRLLDANRRLAAAIRAGAFAPGDPRTARLLAHLRQTTRERLAISNPRALERSAEKSA